MDMNPVGWFEIYVQDMTKAKTFYEKFFQIKLQALDMPEIEMLMFPGKNEIGGATGALVKMQGKSSGGSGTIVYFNCKDCGETASMVNLCGGELQMPKTSIGHYGFIAMVKDPDGNIIGLHSMK